jgi:hypothetical protein
MTDGACSDCKIEQLEKDLEITSQARTAYRIGLENMEASLPKIKADSVLGYAKNMESIEQTANLRMEQGLRMMASFAKKTAKDYANKLEAGE